MWCGPNLIPQIGQCTANPHFLDVSKMPRIALALELLRFLHSESARVLRGDALARVFRRRLQTVNTEAERTGFEPALPA